MVVVGRHASQAEQHKALQAAHVRVRIVPKALHVVVQRDGRAGSVNFLGQSLHRVCVKVYVGDGGEQPLHQQKRLLRGRGTAIRNQLPGVCDERPGEPILRGSGIGRFAADTGFAGTGGAVCGLLALKTKHQFVHKILPFHRRYREYGQ